MNFRVKLLKYNYVSSTIFHTREMWTSSLYFRVPPKRVIIRQGHFAENFYFILSGQGKSDSPKRSLILNVDDHSLTEKIIFLFCNLAAVVRILEKNPKTGDTQLRTATIMRKGTSFGVWSIPIDKSCIAPQNNNN